MVALGVGYNQPLYEDGGGSGISHMLTGSKARIDPKRVYTITKKRAEASCMTKVGGVPGVGAIAFPKGVL